VNLWLKRYSMRCEVSERATHSSSPHGPCEPSARVTGRARTYTMDLPKWDSTLPEAASERDQRSPHTFGLTPAPSSHGYDPYTTTQFSTLSYDATNRRSPYHTDFVTQRPPTIRPVPRHVQPSLVSVLRRSPTPDGPTACLMPMKH
jgi:hypothetical protein